MKSDNAVRAVQNAIEASRAFEKRAIRVFVQGSYRNRTNVRQDSDVDVCVLCSDTLFFDLPPGKSVSDFQLSVPALYPYTKFKSDVEAALVSYFGRENVRRGKKAFDVHENTYRVDADVVACFDYQRFQSNGLRPRGTAFLQDGAGRIINWPEQNYENGVRKNEETGRGFKSAVRILKRLRNDMEEAGASVVKPISSFLIESLVWNVPNDAFGHDTYTKDTRWMLAHLFNNTMQFKDCSEWVEVNDLKYLFRPTQPWTMEQVHTFLAGAWDYVGFQ